MIGIYPVLSLVRKPIYGQYIHVFWLVIITVLISSFGQIPHYALYVRRRDRAIVMCSLAGLFAAIPVQFLLVPRFGPLGAAFGTLCATATIAGGKLWAHRKDSAVLISS
jgi:O-antigen/teichoic acid export membrane protein